MTSFYKRTDGSDVEVVNQLEDYTIRAETAAINSENSAQDSATSAGQSAGSALLSDQYAQDAAASAAAALVSEQNAAQSAMDSDNYSQASAQSAADALVSAGDADQSAQDAAASALEASGYVGLVTADAQAAAISAAAALVSEQNASTSEGNAQGYAQAADQSRIDAEAALAQLVPPIQPWTPTELAGDIDPASYPIDPQGRLFEITDLLAPIGEYENGDLTWFNDTGDFQGKIGSGGIESILGSDNVTVDDTDPKNPVIHVADSNTIKGDWSPEVNGGVFTNIPDGAANNAYRIAGGGGTPLGLVLGDIVAFAPDGQTIYVLNKNYNSKLDDVVEGTNVSIDRTDPTRPKISAAPSPIVAADWAPVLGTLTVPPVLTTEDSTAVNLTITNDNSILRQYHNTGLCHGMFKVVPHQLSFGKLKSAEQGVTLAVRPDTTKPGSFAEVYLGIFGKGAPLTYLGAGPSVVVAIDLVAQEATLRVLSYEVATTNGVIETSAGTTWRLELTESYGNTTIRVWSSASPNLPILTHTTSEDTSELHNFAVGMWCNNTIGTAGRLDVVSYPSTGITNLPEGFENFGYRIANSVLAPQYNILEGDIVVFDSRAYMETVVAKAAYPLAANRTARIEESWEFAKPCEVAGVRLGNTQLDGNGAPVLATGTIQDTHLDTAITLGSRFLGAVTGLLSELVHKGAGFSHLIVTAFATQGYHEGKQHRSRIFTRLASGDTFTKVEQVSEVHSYGVTSELVHAIESDGTVSLTLDGEPVGGDGSAGGGRTQVLTTTGVGLDELEDYGKVYYIDSATDVYVTSTGGFPPPAGETIEATFVQLGAGAVIWSTSNVGFNGGWEDYKTTGVGSSLTVTTDNGWEFYGYGNIEKV